jgi:hypothetical protein
MTEIHVDQDRVTGELQVSIHDGSGGYRLAGPKYVGSSKTLLAHVLDGRDVKEILRHLRHDFQPPPGGGYLCNVCNVQYQHHRKVWIDE